MTSFTPFAIAWYKNARYSNSGTIFLELETKTNPSGCLFHHPTQLLPSLPLRDDPMLFVTQHVKLCDNSLLKIKIRYIWESRDFRRLSLLYRIVSSADVLSDLPT